MKKNQIELPFQMRKVLFGFKIFSAKDTLIFFFLSMRNKRNVTAKYREHKESDSRDMSFVEGY